MKHFITFVSQQSPGSLKSLTYKPGASSGYGGYPHPVSYPIVPVIASVADEGEPIKLTYISSTGTDEMNGWIETNTEKLFEDMALVKPESEVEKQVILTPFDAAPEDLLALTEAIEGCVSEGDEVYACITFGEKPATLALYRALNRVCTDEGQAVVKDCVYGRVLRHDRGAENPGGQLFSMRAFMMRTLSSGEALNAMFSAGSSSADLPIDGLPTEKTKHFITCISLGSEEAFRPAQYYDESGSCALYQPVRFPIVPYIAALAEEGDEIRVTYVVFGDGANACVLDAMERNLGYLKQEIAEAAAWRGIDFKVDYDEVSVPYDYSNEDMVELCDKVEASIGNDEELYACITFGEKPMTVALQQALAEITLGRSLTVETRGLVYGYFSRVKDVPSKLKNVTAFVLDAATELVMRRDEVKNTAAIRGVVLDEKVGE